MATTQPAWFERALPHVQGVRDLARVVMGVCLYLSALVLLAWLVIGTIYGFVTISGLIGAVGLTEVARRLMSRSG